MIEIILGQEWFWPRLTNKTNKKKENVGWILHQTILVLKNKLHLLIRTEIEESTSTFSFKEN